eukprot:TRINITY_DN5461_c0_g1_i2.p1 TRINITY_DN5461_c0_g1~~TRINITY_DN5461_c0_g1_i2.p1  ORF type:complete len:334 (+),score=76.70 TRINITY_DN5461_c0_g1_i2:59-1003(+)
MNDNFNFSVASASLVELGRKTENTLRQLSSLTLNPVPRCQEEAFKLVLCAAKHVRQTKLMSSKLAETLAAEASTACVQTLPLIERLLFDVGGLTATLPSDIQQAIKHCFVQKAAAADNSLRLAKKQRDEFNGTMNYVSNCCMKIPQVATQVEESLENSKRKNEAGVAYCAVATLCCGAAGLALAPVSGGASLTLVVAQLGCLTGMAWNHFKNKEVTQKLNDSNSCLPALNLAAESLLEMKIVLEVCVMIWQQFVNLYTRVARMASEGANDAELFISLETVNTLKQDFSSLSTALSLWCVQFAADVPIPACLTFL